MGPKNNRLGNTLKPELQIGANFHKNSYKSVYSFLIIAGNRKYCPNNIPDTERIIAGEHQVRPYGRGIYQKPVVGAPFGATLRDRDMASKYTGHPQGLPLQCQVSQNRLNHRQ